MKKILSKLSELNSMLILASIISLVILVIFLIVGLTTGYYGWLIGGAIGSVIEIINIVLLYKGSEFVIEKGKPMTFLIFYFARMILYIAAFLVCAMFGFINNLLHTPFIPVFEHSIWGVLIAISPLQIIVIVALMIQKKPLTEIAKKDESEVETNEL